MALHENCLPFPFHPKVATSLSPIPDQTSPSHPPTKLISPEVKVFSLVANPDFPSSRLLLSLTVRGEQLFWKASLWFSITIDCSSEPGGVWHSPLLLFLYLYLRGHGDHSQKRWERRGQLLAWLHILVPRLGSERISPTHPSISLHPGSPVLSFPS